MIGEQVVAKLRIVESSHPVLIELGTLISFGFVSRPVCPHLLALTLVTTNITFILSGHSAGQFCWIQVPSVSAFEWHPFTISSSPCQALGMNGTLEFRYIFVLASLLYYGRVIKVVIAQLWESSNKCMHFTSEQSC